MFAIIKSIQNFSTLAVAQAVSWDLPIATAGDDTGSMVLRGEAAAGREGNWLIFDGRVWLISQSASSKGLTTLTLLPPIKAFDRPLFYPGIAFTSIEAAIVWVLTNSFKDVSDSFFAMPYLNVTSTGATGYVKPELTDDNFFVLSDYAKSVGTPTFNSDGTIAAPGIVCDFSYSDDTLYIHVHSVSPTARTVIFDTSLFQLKSRANDRNVISKISVFTAAGTAQHFYLDRWGVVKSLPPENRIPGKWISVSAVENEAAIDTAKKEFAKNQDAHKIEFYSAQEYGLLDSLTMRLGDAVEAYQITCIRKTSADDRYLYVCGDLPTTLTDKVKRLNR